MKDYYTKRKESEDNYLICPTCSGTGVQNMGFGCKNCASMGVGVYHNKFFFYWSPKLSYGQIELRRMKLRLHKFLNLLALFVGLLGLISLGAWMYQVSNITVRLESFAFWREKHDLLKFFWLSTIADLFVIYRISIDAQKSSAIKVFKYDQYRVGRTTLNSWADLVGASSKEKIDISKAYSEDAYRVVEEAYLLAKKLGNNKVDPMHLFFSALTSNEVSSIFARLNIDASVLIKKLKDQLKKKGRKGGKILFSLELKQTLIDAYLESGKNGQKKVDPKNFLATAMNNEKLLAEVLSELELDESKVANTVLWFVINEKQVASYKKFKHEARFKPSNNMDKAYTALATPILNNYGYDLTLAAKWSKLEYCVAREREIEESWENMESGANGVLLVGDDGVGKRAVIAGIAERMVEEDVPKFLLDKRLIEIDTAKLVSGASPEKAEGRMSRIIDEVTRAGNIVLYISNIESIVGITSGSEASVDLAEVFVSAIERKRIYAFATTTSEKYLKYIEGGSVDKNMAKVQIDEPKGDKAIQIIESRIFGIEDKHSVYFTYGALEQAVALSEKYMHDSYLPQKAMTVLEQTAVKVAKTDSKRRVVTKDEVARQISEITNIPVTKISESEGRELLNIEEKIHGRMIGQDEAVKIVAASLRRARTQLRQGVRPISSFLFLGPTGVGKTELAKTVADTYFGDEKYMIRIDMSEYQHPDSVKKMIGDSSGVKGVLTEKVRKSPFALVLLDEIEKAHGEIMNLFLQVMDDGHLSDGQGRTIDFTNSIIIATSNVGAKFIQDEINKDTEVEKIRTAVINDQLNKVLRPELINRFDGIIVFEPLSIENVVDIARLMITNVEKMLNEKGMEIEVDETGLRRLAKMGFDPQYGARPLRRLLQEKIENIIANKILSGELKRRDTVVITDIGEIRVEKGQVL